MRLRPTIACWSCRKREFGERQKPRILDRCNPMAETREILSVGCKRHEHLNAVLADQHGEVLSFLGGPVNLLIALADVHYAAEHAFIRSEPSPSMQR